MLGELPVIIQRCMQWDASVSDVVGEVACVFDDASHVVVAHSFHKAVIDLGDDPRHDAIFVEGVLGAMVHRIRPIAGEIDEGRNAVVIRIDKVALRFARRGVAAFVWVGGSGDYFASEGLEIGKRVSWKGVNGLLGDHFMTAQPPSVDRQITEEA